MYSGRHRQLFDQKDETLSLTTVSNYRYLLYDIKSKTKLLFVLTFVYVFKGKPSYYKQSKYKIKRKKSKYSFFKNIKMLQVVCFFLFNPSLIHNYNIFIDSVIAAGIRKRVLLMRKSQKEN